MKLWHLRVNKMGSKPPSFCGSFKLGVFQLWWGTHIWQLVFSWARESFGPQDDVQKQSLGDA